MREKLSQTKIMFAISLILVFLFVWGQFFGFRFWDYNFKNIDIPVENFRCVGYSKSGSTFTSTQADPQMYVDMDGTTCKYIYVEVENVSEKTGTVLQVFYTEDGAYTEKNSVKITLHQGKNRVSFPRTVKLSGLRMDIGETQGVSFELKAVSCTNGLTEFGIRLVLCELLIGLCWLIGTNYDKVKAYVLKNKWEFCIMGIAFGVYFIWSIVIPYNEAPDEYMRYDVAKYIYTYHKLPRGDAPILCDNVWGISYAFKPYLAYLISAGFMFVASVFECSAFELFHVARLASVLFSTITVWYCTKIAKEILDKKSGKLFVVMVGFWPQFVFISSYVNNDSLAIMSTAMIVYYWIRGFKTKWDWKTYVGLGVALAICVASYRNVYGYGVCSALLFVCYYLVEYKKTKDVTVLKEMLKKGIIICGIVALISGWWFVRNYILYDGDILGNETGKVAKLKYAAPNYKPGMRKNLYQQGISLKQMFFEMNWIKISLGSFVAAFGYMSVRLSNWCYVLYFAVLGMGCLGHMATWKKKTKPQFNRLLLITMWLAMGIVLALSIYYSYFIDFQPQGRYLLPVIVPLMLLLSAGIARFEERIEKRTNWRISLTKIVMIFLVVSSILVLTNIIIPHYYWTEELIQDTFWKW